MAYITSQVGPYGYFATSKGNGTDTIPLSTVYVNRNGTTAGATAIYVNNDGSVSKVKQVWVNDGGVPKLVSPLQTVVMDLIDGDQLILPDTNPTGTQTWVGQFTMNGATAHLPVGWTGKISYWIGSTMLIAPTNTPASGLTGFAGARVSSDTANAGINWCRQVGGSSVNLYGVIAGYLPPPVNGIIDGHVGNVAAAHETTYINANGTPFAFSGYHSYTALPAKWTGLQINWDGEQSKGDQLIVQKWSKLRMAVTSTSNIYPTYGV